MSILFWFSDVFRGYWKRPVIFWCFQGVLKEISGMKWVNEFSSKNETVSEMVSLAHILSNFAVTLFNKKWQSNLTAKTLLLSQFLFPSLFIIYSTSNNSNLDRHTVSLVLIFDKCTDKLTDIFSLIEKIKDRIKRFGIPNYESFLCVPNKTHRLFNFFTNHK